MIRLFAIVSMMLASPLAASPYVPLTEQHLNPGVVEILVAPEDLARCRLTVEQVLTTPPVPATSSAPQLQQVTAEPFVAPFTGPQVVCVLEKGA